MEKDRALNLLQNGLLPQVHGAYYEALKMVIDDWKMEQKEPFINKPCVSEQACHEDKMKVLEKIKAEMQDIMIVSQDEERIYQEIKAIIDKYMAESEEV